MTMCKSCMCERVITKMNLPFTEWNSIEMKCVRLLHKWIVQRSCKQRNQNKWIYTNPKTALIHHIRIETITMWYITIFNGMEKMHNTKGNTIFISITWVLKVSYERKVKWIDAMRCDWSEDAKITSINPNQSIFEMGLLTFLCFISRIFLDRN